MKGKKEMKKKLLEINIILEKDYYSIQSIKRLFAGFCLANSSLS